MVLLVSYLGHAHFLTLLVERKTGGSDLLVEAAEVIRAENGPIGTRRQLRPKQGRVGNIPLMIGNGLTGLADRLVEAIADLFDPDFVVGGLGVDQTLATGVAPFKTEDFVAPRLGGRVARVEVGGLGIFVERFVEPLGFLRLAGLLYQCIRLRHRLSALQVFGPGGSVERGVGGTVPGRGGRGGGQRGGSMLGGTHPVRGLFVVHARQISGRRIFPQVRLLTVSGINRGLKVASGVDPVAGSVFIAGTQI